ncbi:fatty acid hydroxylase superfamily-domain-containing protein [Massariosphaeria phaeospora]|uniref:Fatty acid hydroxylase superfamily-domain-containing protein n=1 Tax=Massariosphaeria phaeospora TaxID=100035 RepID=A0A7C8MDN4_9PLEO|nr:fatty acid hydroxylase superfamily-domain-containing protein [Massariosphaeria phaeospora]
MATSNLTSELPPLPAYTLRPLPPLISGLADCYVQMALPVIGYWTVSLIFHVIDVYDLFPKQRLHTPAEVLKRNHVSRWEVFRDVVVQQLVQTAVMLCMAYLDEVPMHGKADYDVAWYAQKLRLAQRAIPYLLATVGLDSSALAASMSASQPMFAGAVSGGRYPGLLQQATIEGEQTLVPAFAPWELAVARVLYYYAIPAVQFFLGFIVLDIWEYFWHRAMHMNKWLYVNIHSRHHRLYVPYAYGSLYNHPVEGFILDTLGTGVGYLILGMTMRQSFFYFTFCTIKTVDDHSGYHFAWDPLQFIFPNNAAYHDIHHQSWGIKTNFSQPFFTFWDRVGGTMYMGDVAERYERARRTAQQKLEQEQDNNTVAESAKNTMASVPELDATARSQPISAPRSSRKKASSISQSSAGNLKGLTNKVNESLHGRRASVLGMDSSH